MPTASLTRIRRRAALAAACLASALLLSLGGRSAEAQMASVMSTHVYDERTTFSPAISRADLEVFARALLLSDDERRAMQDLYDAFAATMAAEGQDVREFCADVIERSELLQDQRLLEPARKRVDAWRERAKQLEANFLDDLRMLLTREQESRWPILERYSVDLDRAIVARDAVIEEESGSFNTLVREDPQDALALFDRARRLREPTRGERYIRAAGDLALETEQAERVRAVIAEYDRARRRLLDRMAAADWEEQYNKLPRSLAEALGQVPEGEVNYFRAFGLGEDHPLTALRLERYELDRATRAKIDALLTPEQRRLLPDTGAGHVTYSDWAVWGL